MDLDSTIIACASPPGRSLRAIIRITGQRAFDLFTRATHQLPPPTRAARPITIHLPAAHLTAPAHLPLSALALTYPAPHSYTGQHSVELLVPGNPDLSTRIIDHLIHLGSSQPSLNARLATPGEFTARAFHMGRLSLTQAEGIAATIAARTDAEVRAAHHLRSGSFAKTFAHLTDDLANALALVEAGIDFTDQEDVHPIAPPQLIDRLTAIHSALTTMLDRGIGVERLHDVPSVVLLGKPNAGKSTLFNALLARNRAAVSPTAGSTRDILAEPLTVPTPQGQAEVLLIDMPGIDQFNNDAPPPTPLDHAMRAAARQAVTSADLILLCTEASDQSQLSDPSSDALALINNDTARLHTPIIRITTKCDRTRTNCVDAARSIRVSALDRIGLNEVCAAIGRALVARTVSLGADALALSARHQAAMRTAREHLDAALLLLRPTADARILPEPELLAASMRAALDHLGSITGTITSDDVLGRIFTTFCIGK